MKIIEPGILIVAVTLYISGLGWAMSRGPDSTIVGLLMGCGSIAIGVWLGLTIAERQRATAADAAAVTEITIGRPGSHNGDDDDPSI